jgi:hypothetical protein
VPLPLGHWATFALMAEFGWADCTQGKTAHRAELISWLMLSWRYGMHGNDSNTLQGSSVGAMGCRENLNLSFNLPCREHGFIVERGHRRGAGLL